MKNHRLEKRSSALWSGAVASLAAAAIGAMCWGAGMAAEPPPEGHRQSPVNIDTHRVRGAPAPAIKLHYANPVELSVVDTYNPSNSTPREYATLRANVPPGSYVEIGKEKYNLLQFHFHIPAEHSFDGRRPPMELHLVHLREGAKPCDRGPDALLVIGAPIEIGETSKALEPIFGKDAALPADASAPALKVADFDINALITDLARTDRYAGSLTAPAEFPACKEPEGGVAAQLASNVFPENVSWVVLERPLTVSPRQFARMANLFEEGDARPVQPLNGRKIIGAVSKP